MRFDCKSQQEQQIKKQCGFFPFHTFKITIHSSTVLIKKKNNLFFNKLKTQTAGFKQLEDEINVKDQEIITVTSEFNEVKFALQRKEEECDRQRKMQSDLEQQVMLACDFLLLISLLLW